MCISMARSHRDWCKKVYLIHSVLFSSILKLVKNLEAWQEAKKEIANLPDHPNRLPDSELEGLGEPSGAGGETTGLEMPSNNRRDSGTILNGR